MSVLTDYKLLEFHNSTNNYIFSSTNTHKLIDEI